MELIDRSIVQVLQNRLELFPAVYLMGPRQVGKTTTAKSLGGRYFDLQSDMDWVALDLGWSEIVSKPGLIILDEAQSRTEVFARLRSEIDRHRKKMGRFLLLGSIAPSLIKEIGESLAGRVSRVEMSPLNFSEVSNITKAEDLWFYGGFPDGGLLDSRLFPVWQNDYLTSIASLDIPELGGSLRPNQFLQMFSLLASAHGTLWNASEIGKSLGLTYHTVNRQVSLLAEMLLVRLLPAYHIGSFRKRITKKPKFYWRDSGLLHALLGLPSLPDLKKNRALGLSFEGFIIQQVISYLDSAGVTFKAYHFRTSDQKEIDLIIEAKNNLICIEVKLSSQPQPAAIQELEKLTHELGGTYSLLICNTPQNVSGTRVEVLDLPAALRVLSDLLV